MRARTMLIAGGIIAVIGGAYVWAQYNRPVETAGTMDTVLTVVAADLHQAFITNEAAANAKYVGKTEQAIQVKGVIRAVETTNGGSSVVLETADAMAGVVCEFKNDALPMGWKTGDTVALKGICTGVNDLIPDVILVRCTAVE